MKNELKFNLKDEPVSYFSGKIWQHPKSKSSDDPVTTSGLICTLITRS